MLYKLSNKSWQVMAVALILALVAGLVLVPSPAAAQGGNPGQPPSGLPAKLASLRPVLGQVTQLGTDQFTLTTRNGVERTFRYDERTRFINPERKLLSAADLVKDGWVAVATQQPGRAGRLLGRPLGRLFNRRQGAPAVGQPASQGQPLPARIVVILPDDFDPDQMQVARGQVTGVDPAANQFTLQNRQGAQNTLTVDSETRFTGEAAGLSELEIGMNAFALAEKQVDGSLLAQRVRAGYIPQRQVGEITAVDQAAGQFTLKTLKGGEELAVSVDENTRFRGKDQRVKSLADLQPGMLVMANIGEENGAYTAQIVVVLKRLGR